MRILLLAPHPFYQDRGTPIAVDLVLRVLSERGDDVDVLTFHEGKDRHYQHVHIHRIPALPFLRNIRPGFSWKKLVCDGLMCGKVMVLLFKKRYQLVHAVEEAAFIALLVKWLVNIPYVYDMDSSLAQQMVEKYPQLSTVSKFFAFCERQVVRHAGAVMPVCEVLAKTIQPYHPSKVLVLEDVPLFTNTPNVSETVKQDLSVDGIRVLYVGNLETYQGIDLLLESFALVVREVNQATLFIVGGNQEDIASYQHKAHELDIERHVRFLGPRPIQELSAYLSQADILVSPRIKGNNTPMKLYSYLASGKAVLATNLATHTQVVQGPVALLADPEPEPFAKGMVQLIVNEELRHALGREAQKLVKEKYSLAAYQKKLNALYDDLKDTGRRVG